MVSLGCQGGNHRVQDHACRVIQFCPRTAARFWPGLRPRRSSSPQGRGSPSRAPSGTLSVSVLDFLEVSLKPVFAAYEAARPVVKIDYSVLPLDRRRAAPGAAVAPHGQQAAGHHLSRRHFRHPVRRGRDYRRHARLPQFRRADHTAASFAKTFLDQYLIVSGPKKDGIYGLPQGADTVVLFYNKKHFDDAKLPTPRRQLGTLPSRWKSRPS